MNYYKRKLPHWQPKGAEYFITIRLKRSLPKTAIQRLKSSRKKMNDTESKELDTHIQRKIFKEYEDVLDKGITGPKWFSKKEIAKLVGRSIRYRDSKVYNLYAYCIMPNHVHLVFRHLIKDEHQETPVTYIMRDFKRYTGRKCNELLNRTGAFWQPESYDRVIRDQEELENTIRYTLNNPVKAGFVDRWEDWDYSYCERDFTETFLGYNK